MGLELKKSWWHIPKERARYDDILAEYNACYPDRLQDLTSTIQKEQYSSKVDATHALKSGKCGTFSVRYQELKSNRGPDSSSLYVTSRVKWQ